MDKKALSYLSISQKAGLVVTGEGACEKAISSGQAKLVIIASDASDNTKKKFLNKSLYYKIPNVVWGLRDEISRAIGKNNRPVAVIIDKGLADRILLFLRE